MRVSRHSEEIGTDKSQHDEEYGHEPTLGKGQSA